MLRDDAEWGDALRDALHTDSPAAVRRLFATIVHRCSPANLRALFDAFLLTEDRDGLGADFARQLLDPDHQRISAAMYTGRPPPPERTADEARHMCGVLALCSVEEHVLACGREPARDGGSLLDSTGLYVPDERGRAAALAAVAGLQTARAPVGSCGRERARAGGEHRCRNATATATAAATATTAQFKRLRACGARVRRAGEIVCRG